MVLRWMPKNVSEVAGPSTLDSLMGALIVLHSASIVWRFCSHMLELAGPAVKKLSN